LNPTTVEAAARLVDASLKRAAEVGSPSFQSVEPVEVGCYDCEKARADARAFLREIDGGTPEEKS